MSGGSLADSVNGVKFVSFHESSGYGIAARRYLLGLRNCAVPFTWTPMVPGKGWGLWYEPFRGSAVGDPILDPFCNRQVPYGCVIVHTVPEYYLRWIEQEKGKRMIGCTVWETDHLPQHWPTLLNSMDRLLVPCRWNREVFRQCGVTVPIDVIPHVAPAREPANASAPESAGSGDYVFYTIGAWTARKAIWNTIRCYLDTFTAADPTLLLVKTGWRDLARRSRPKPFFASTRHAVRKILSRYRDPARIRLIRDELSDEAMLALHARGDCYVSLTRSEGWGLGAFDAAAFGRPVIMTGYGGQLDFLPEDLAFLVRYDIVPAKATGGESSIFTPEQNWAEPSVQHGAQLMRWVFENREEARARGQALRAHVRRHYREEVVMEKLIRSIAGS